MSFLLKKFVSFWLMPVPLCLALLGLSWALAGAESRRRLCRRLSAAGFILLLLFSNKVVSKWLVSPLESRFAPIPELQPGEALPPRLAACRYVVVLGGGHTDMPGLSAGAKLSSAALPRLVEGVRLARALPGSELIVSGPAVGANPSHATILAQAAEVMGIPGSRIRQITTARDTEDEARAVREIAGGEPVALVTSAWHMPRAAALFRGAGVSFVPCPAGFTARFNADFRWDDLTWDVESLERSTVAVHEGLGYAWEALRGKTR